MIELILDWVPFELIAAAVTAVVLLVASLHPRVSLAMGVICLGAAAVLLSIFDRRYFHSDGSAAGLVGFVFYAGVIVASVFFGVVFLYAGLVTKRRRIPDAAGTAVAVALLAGAIAWPAWVWRDRYLPQDTAARWPAADEAVKGSVQVKDALRLEWKRRGLDRALRLAIPAHDLAARAIPTTSDGPREVPLALAGFPEARLTLHRDRSTLPPQVAGTLKWPDNVLPEVPGNLWVDVSKGGWKVIGAACEEREYLAFDCHRPEAPLARHLPFAYGLASVRLRSDRLRDPCLLVFEYRARPVTLETRGPCLGPESLAAFKATAELLHRLGADSEAPPGPADMAPRLAAGLARCEAASREAREAMAQGGDGPAAMSRVDATCDPVVNAAAPLAAKQPEAAGALLAALDARVHARANIAPHVPALQAYLATAPDGSRESLWAHALVVSQHAGNTAADRLASVRASLDRLPQAAIDALAPDDRVVESIHRALDAAAVDESLLPRQLEFLRAWDAKARAAAPDSDLALRVRFELCRSRTFGNAERETLGECAAQLFAAWQRRLAEGKVLDVGVRESDFALTLAHMHQSHAWSARDFAAGAGGVRRVRDLVASRPPFRGHDEFLAALDKMESELAAKARGGR